MQTDNEQEAPEETRLAIAEPQTPTPRTKGLPFGGDPSAAGRKGAAVRTQNRIKRLDTTRDYLVAHSLRAARYVTDAYDHDGPDPTTDRGLRAATDVLDRTVGKAAQELRVGPAEQTMLILRELDEESSDG